MDIEEEEDVTLEERTKKEMDEKAKKVQGKGVKVTEIKRKRRIGGDGEENSENEEVEQVSKKKSKKKDEDDDYEPDANSTKPSFVSPKKTRRSVAAAAESKEIKETPKSTSKQKAAAPATLEETPDNIPKKSGQVTASVQKQDTQAGKMQSESATELPGKKGQAGVKIQTIKSDPSKVSKPKDNNEVINLDSPVKDDKAKVAVKSNSVVASKSVSIVKIDDEIQEVKSADQAGKKDETVKSSTQKLYDTRFELFKEFCSTKAGGGVDPMKASTAVIEKFLQHIQKEKNLGKSVLSGYKSAIVKIQTDHKSQPEVVKSGSQPESNKPSVVAKSVTTRATITPVEAKTTTPQPVKPAQATPAVAAKTTTQSGSSPAQPQSKNQQTPQSRAAVAP